MKFFILLTLMGISSCNSSQQENLSGIIVKPEQLKIQEHLTPTENPFEYKVKRKIVITLDLEK